MHVVLPGQNTRKRLRIFVGPTLEFELSGTDHGLESAAVGANDIESLPNGRVHKRKLHQFEVTD